MIEIILLDLIDLVTLVAIKSWNASLVEATTLSETVHIIHIINRDLHLHGDPGGGSS